MVKPKKKRKGDAVQVAKSVLDDAIKISSKKIDPLAERKKRERLN